jgi:phage baseplate assembly protein V
MQTNELYRLILNLVRKGTILAVDHDKGLCRVESGDMQTNWINWLTLAAGETTAWNPPTVGELVLLLCPGGDAAEGVALRGINTDEIPPPSNKPTTHTMKYPDGAVIEYDHQAHTLDIKLPGSALVRIVSASAVNIKTAIANVDGSIKASGNITAGTGASGSFTTPTGQVVTVMDGIVVNIF